MADQGRAPAHGEVQELPAALVPQAAALAARDHRQEIVRQAELAVGDAGRKTGQRALGDLAQGVPSSVKQTLDLGDRAQHVVGERRQVVLGAVAGQDPDLEADTGAPAHL